MRSGSAPISTAMSLGVGFVLVEAGLAWAGVGHRLDPVPHPLEVAGLAALLGGVFAVTTTLINRVAAGWGLVTTLVAWALVWGPHGARLARVPEAMGWAVAVAVLILLAWRPRFAWPTLVLGAAWTPALRFLSLDEGGGGAKVVSSGSLPSVLLVTVDTARAGSGLVHELPEGSPSAPRHAFRTALAPAPWTLPSMHSLFLGQPVRVHGGGLEVGSEVSLPETVNPGLASSMGALGLETWAVTCNPHLVPEMGFSRGFDHWLHADDAAEVLVLRHQIEAWRTRWTGRVERVRHLRDSLIVDQVSELLARPDAGPSFIWVHLLGPHEYRRDPVRPHEGWHPEHRDEEALRTAYGDGLYRAREQLIGLMEGIHDPTRWIVAITADHGEALGEEGVWGHGHRLSDPELRVPLVVQGPGVPPGITEDPVTLSDLAPTLLALASAHGPGPLFSEIRDVLPVGGVRADPEAFANRLPDGTYQAVRPALPLATTQGWERHRVDALQALGYTEVPGNTE